MARQIKDKKMSVRVESAFENQINEYVDAAGLSSSGELFRRGAKEYMHTHPVKTPKSESINPSLKSLAGKE